MHVFFDLLIFGFLIGDAWLILSVFRKKSPLQSIPAMALLVVALISWGVIFYGSFLEPKNILINEQLVQIDQQKEKQLKAAVISDIHVGPYKGEAFVEKLVDRTLEQNPDIVLLLGDYVYKKAEDAQKLAPLKQLTETVPVYAIMGNHDYDLPGDKRAPDDELAEAIRSTLIGYGVHVLENRGTYIANDVIYLAGVQEIWTHRAEPARSLGLRQDRDTPTIMMVHNPDLFASLDPALSVDLLLSGHTHGGQIRLPFIGPVGRIPNELGQEFDQGFFEQNDTKLFITSGAGESGPRARLFNQPEIVILTINY